MSQIRDIVLNKIIDVLMIITSKEWSRLVILIIIIIVVTTVWYFIRKAQKEIALVDELYGRENLAVKLGWKDIKYPIIWFGWEFAEPVHVFSRDDLKKDFSSWLQARYIIDWELKHHNLTPIRLKDLGVDDVRISHLKFKKIEESDALVNIEELKKLIINEIKKANKEGPSGYALLELEIEQTKNINELVQVMNKGEF